MEVALAVDDEGFPYPSIAATSPSACSPATASAVARAVGEPAWPVTVADADRDKGWRVRGSMRCGPCS